METRANRISSDTTSRGSGSLLPAKSAFRLNTSRCRAQIVPEIHAFQIPVYTTKNTLLSSIVLLVYVSLCIRPNTHVQYTRN